MNFRIILILMVAFVGSHKAMAQDYDTTATQLQDIQKVIDAYLPEVEHFLHTQKTFRPFAGVILANDSLAEIHVSDTAKESFTEADLKESLSIDALKGVYKVIVIFYQTEIADDAKEKPKKAVGVFAEHTDDDFAYLFYYPYTIDVKKTVKFEESFGDFAPQVMFKP